MRSKSLCLLLSLLCASGVAAAQPDSLRTDTLYVLSLDSLRQEKALVRLPHTWRYHPGDSPAFADPALEDAAWDTLDTRMLAEQGTPPGWDGVGWFRWRFRADSTVQGVPLGLRLYQLGASEVYLNGDRLYAVGEVGRTSATTDAQMQRLPYVFLLDERDEHVLAVRYANHEVPRFQRTGWFAGFISLLGEANAGVRERVHTVRVESAFQLFFIGVFAAFALLHLLLYAFYPQAVENLYFALLIASVATFAYLIHQVEFTTDPGFLVLLQRLINTNVLAIIGLGLLFVYQIFYPKRPQAFYVLLASGIAFGILAWFRLDLLVESAALRVVFFGFFFLTMLEMLRVVGVALYRKKQGARIVGFGIGMLALSLAYVLLIQLDVLPPPFYHAGEIPFIGALLLATSMSVYLSRDVSQTARRLKKQLVRVQELSEQHLEEEVRRSRLEAEYRQKVQELEEARQLQLSMLPQQLPTLPDLEIAAHMETAAEVGGDYYDFRVEEDSTLVVAIGDATGHGMQASTMVTATKSLFNALGGEPDLLQVFDRSTRALKGLGLRKLYMALTLARYKDGHLRMVAAGMPPALVYRAAAGTVERVLIKAMPLGSFPDFPYREEALTLAPGDAVLFMSDGFPERFNPVGEMLGYATAEHLFAQAAHGTPGDIIGRLVAEEGAWSDGRPADDDVTFVVLKRHGASPQPPPFASDGAADPPRLA